MNKKAFDRANGYFLAGALALLLLFGVALYDAPSTSVLIWWSVVKGALALFLLAVTGICALMGFACLASAKDKE